MTEQNIPSLLTFLKRYGQTALFSSPFFVISLLLFGSIGTPVIFVSLAFGGIYGTALTVNPLYFSFRFWFAAQLNFLAAVFLPTLLWQINCLALILPYAAPCQDKFIDYDLLLLMWMMSNIGFLAMFIAKLLDR